jgi:hypothetical protein
LATFKAFPAMLLAKKREHRISKNQVVQFFFFFFFPKTTDSLFLSVCLSLSVCLFSYVSLFSLSLSLSQFCARIRKKNNSLKTLGWVLTTQTTASWRFRFAATPLPLFQTSALSLSLCPSVRVCLSVFFCRFLCFSVSVLDFLT